MSRRDAWLVQHGAVALSGFGRRDVADRLRPRAIVESGDFGRGPVRRLARHSSIIWRVGASDKSRALQGELAIGRSPCVADPRIALGRPAVVGRSPWCYVSRVGKGRLGLVSPSPFGNGSSGLWPRARDPHDEHRTLSRRQLFVREVLGFEKRSGRISTTE